MSELVLEDRTVGPPAIWGAAAAGAGLIAGALAYATFAIPGAARLVLLGVLGVIALAGVVAIAWRPWLGVVGMLAVLPLDTAGRIIEQPVTITAFHLVLFVSLASWVAHLALRRETLKFSWLDLGLGLLLVAAAWSLPNSLNSSATTMAIVRLAFLWTFELFVANQLRTRGRIDAALWTLLATGAAMGALAFAQARVPGFSIGNVHAQGPVDDQLMRPAGFFDDPNYLAGFLSCAIVVAAAMLIFERRWLRGIALAVLGAAAGAGLLVTYSRTAWVGALVGIVIVVLTAPRKRRIVFVSIGLVLVLVAAVFGSGTVLARLESSADVQNDSSVGTRVLMLRSNIEMIRDDWVIGTGLGAFDKRYPQYRQTGSLPDILRPHQVPLALWAETGVMGLVAEIALIAGLVAIFWRRRPNGWTVGETAALAGIASLFTQSLFQYYLYFEYVWLFLALAVAATRLTSTPQEES